MGERHVQGGGSEPRQAGLCGVDASAAVDRLRDLEAGPSAVVSVAAIGSAAVPALEELLRGRPDSVSQPRRLAATALGIIGSRAAKSALRRSVQDSLDRVLEPVLSLSEDEVVSAVADAIARSPESEDAEILRWALERRPNAAIARALAGMHDVASIPLLVRCLSDDTSADAAKDALRTLGTPAVAALTAVALLPSSEGEEGATAVRARVRALEVLGRIGGEATDLPLVWALSDGEREVRITAALALAGRGPVGSRVAAEVLFEALADERWFVGEEATAALAALGLETVRYVRRFLRSGGSLLPLRAVALLRQIPDREATDALVHLAKDPSRRVRLAVTEALAARGNEDARQALKRLTGDPDRVVRMRAHVAFANGDEASRAGGFLARWRERRKRRCTQVEGPGDRPGSISK